MSPPDGHSGVPFTGSFKAYVEGMEVEAINLTKTSKLNLYHPRNLLLWGVIGILHTVSSS